MMKVTTSAEVIIDAPLGLVWNAITNVRNYAEWNPLIRSASGEAVVGQEIEMLICPPGLMRRLARVEVLAVKPEQEFRWLGRWGLPGVLDGDHAFRLDPVGEKTRVLQVEYFSGVLARPLKRLLVPSMTEGFELMNGALKSRCEELASTLRRGRC